MQIFVITSIYKYKNHFNLSYFKLFLPLASGDNCEIFDACLLFALNSGSKNATGKHEANELRQSPSNGR